MRERGQHRSVEEEWFGEVYSRFRSYVGALLRGFSVTGEDLPDLEQLVWQRVWQRGSAPSWSSWIYVCTRNVVFDHWRAIERRRAGLERLRSLLPEPRSAWKSDSSPALLKSEVEKLLDGLPRGRREVVELRYAKGLSFEEIAAAAGISVGTARSQHHRALMTLRTNARRLGWDLDSFL